MTLVVIFFVGVVCIFNSFNEARWISNGVIINDVACYYGYLPTFINHKTDELTKEEISNPYLHPANKYVVAPNGNKVLKTTMGMAYCYLPFYLTAYAAHFIIHGNAGSGMEVEYRFVMQFFGTFCLLAALVFLRRLLKGYFSEAVIAITLCVIVFATNAFYYTTYEGCMTHVCNMALFLWFMLVVRKWYSNSSILNSIFLGLLAGLIVLIRPTNLVIGVFFLLLGVSTLDDFKDRLSLLVSKWYLILLMGFAAFLVWLPQLAYWHELTGRFFFYSYVNETFFFLKPKIFYGMLGWRKGWLIYTPTGFLMLLGFVVMYKSMREWFIASVVFYALFVYIIFSWWCWWYGGSFGCRAMVDVYGILAFPLACLLSSVYYSQHSKAVRITFSVLLIFLVGFNLFQTWQGKKGFIHNSNMTYEAYKFSLFRCENIPAHLLSEPPWGDASEGKYAP